MRKNNKNKFLAMLLAVALVVGAIPAISLLTEMKETLAAADTTPEWVESLTVDLHEEGQTTNQAQGYNLLQDATNGVAFNEGDTWKFKMDVTFATKSSPTGLASRFGFGVKEINGDYADIATITGGTRYKGVDTSGNPLWTWPTGTADWSDNWAAGETWNFTFTVKAYESISMIATCNSVEKISTTIEWAKFYDLKDITAESDATFKPYLMFQSTDAEVKNVRVFHSSEYVEDTTRWVEGLTVDLYEEGQTTNYAQGYNLLQDATNGVTFHEGDIWKFKADVTFATKSSPTGLASRFGFGVKEINSDYADIATITGGTRYKGVDTSGNPLWTWPTGEADWSDNWAAGETWNFTFTVKAYESVSMIATCNSVEKISITIEWEKFYDLKDITAESDVTFKPYLMFQSTDAEVKNVTVSYKSAYKEDATMCVASVTADLYEEAQSTDKVQGYNLLQDATNGITFNVGDIWKFTADVTFATKSSPTGLASRFGFGVKEINGDYADIAIITGGTRYKGVDTSGNALWTWPTGEADWSDNWAAGETWNFTFIVKAYESVSMIATCNAIEKISTTIEWENFYDLKDITAESDATFKPYFMFQSTDAEVKNVQVFYVMTSSIQALDEVIDAADNMMVNGDVTNPTFTSANEMNTAFEQALTIWENPGAYTWSNINEAIRNLETAMANYKEATAIVTVGDGTLTEKVEIGIAADEALPTGEDVDGKYIFGWTYEGEAVDKYTNETDESKYVANFFDKKMLTVKVQTKADEDDKVTARFISSVDDYQREEYECLGFVLSTTTEDPLLATNPSPLTKEVYIVWDELYANNELKNTDDVFNDGVEGGYSNYMFALDVDGLKDNSKVYVRAFVKLTDGTVVYGEPCTKDIVVTQ